MCAFSRLTKSVPHAPAASGIPPETERDLAPPHFLSQRQPPFLSRRSKNAVGALVGAAALAGAAALGAAALTAAAVAAAWRVRANRLRGKIVLITGSSRGLGLAM